MQPQAATGTTGDAAPWLLKLEEEYRLRQKSKSISTAPALPILRRFASECDTCVEFGVRTATSTIALLLGCRGKVYSYEMEKLPQWHDPLKKLVGDKWVLTYGRSEKSDVPECDLLFHDSWHNYEQVKAELDAHADKARKYLLFHDSIGCAGPFTQKNNGVKHRGFRLAVDELMIRDTSWFIKEHHDIKGGLLVLERR